MNFIFKIRQIVVGIRYKQPIFQNCDFHFWRVFDIWPLCAAALSQQQEQQSQSTSAGTIGLSNCVGRSEITTIALNDVGSSSFNHVIHPNHLNETVLHHHHHASAENADASANGE